jgi:hypothetical protein
MIQIITIGTGEIADQFSDETGLIECIEFDVDSIPDGLPLYPPAPDLIYIRPDWPPLGSPDFAARLRAWHAEHNPPQVTQS